MLVFHAKYIFVPNRASSFFEIFHKPTTRTVTEVVIPEDMKHHKKKKTEKFDGKEEEDKQEKEGEHDEEGGWSSWWAFCIEIKLNLENNMLLQ